MARTTIKPYLQDADIAKLRGLVKVSEAAQAYAAAVADTAHYQQVLSAGYDAWREESGNQYTDIDRGSKEWNAMMAATKPEYRYLQNAKSRERRAHKNLLAAVEG